MKGFVSYLLEQNLPSQRNCLKIPGSIASSLLRYPEPKRKRLVKNIPRDQLINQPQPLQGKPEKWRLEEDLNRQPQRADSAPPSRLSSQVGNDHIGVFRFSDIFSNLAISLRIRARGKKYLSDIVLEYIVFAC